MDRIVGWLLRPTTFKSYTAYGEDTDGNTRYNYLVINVTLNVSEAGNYTIDGSLYDKNSNFIDNSKIDKYLNAGMQTVPLKFDGYKIYNHGGSGNYKLKFLEISKKDMVYGDEVLDYAIDPYAAPYYSYMAFDRVFTGDYSESNKSFYEQEGDVYRHLTINITVNITTAGYYIIKGELYDNNGQFITKSGNLSYLEGGIQAIPLNFKGFYIYQNEVDGEYYLDNLEIKDIKGNTLDHKLSAYTTLSYNHENFKCVCFDNDNDSVCDYMDACPNTQEGCDVDSTGCKIDSDGDGICNGIDPCPDDPENCCIADTDTDSDDLQEDNPDCPNYDNFPDDHDNDGINTSADCDDNNSTNTKTKEDTDEDGMNNCNDPCPDDAANQCGCIDSDGDGFNKTMAACSTGTDCDDNNALIIPAIDNLNVSQDLTFCANSYNINDTGPNGVIIINSSDIILDCNNATLNGTGSGYGIYNPGFDNVTIKNCKITNYEYGIYIENSDSSKIVYNQILYNNIGIYSFGSNSTINSNLICKNNGSDLNSSNWQMTSGENNTCGNVHGVGDTETVGCVYPCCKMGDIECDLDIDLEDFVKLCMLYTGPGPLISTSHNISLDEDNDIDLVDFIKFFTVYQGPK